jgi:hypothetical protein
MSEAPEFANDAAGPAVESDEQTLENLQQMVDDDDESQPLLSQLTSTRPDLLRALSSDAASAANSPTGTQTSVFADVIGALWYVYLVVLILRRRMPGRLSWLVLWVLVCFHTHTCLPSSVHPLFVC